MSEFERVAKDKRIAELEAQCDAQYARYKTHEDGMSEDISAKDKRIEELEAQIADFKEDLIDALQDVINYAPACTSSIEYAEKRLKELTEEKK